MILPIRTNIQPRRTPYANYALILINAVVFVLTFGPHRDPLMPDQVEPLKEWAIQYMFWPNHLFWYQYITYAFLHASWLHIIGNMFFLYLFGNNVCDKLGTAKFLLLYFAGAAFAAAGQTWIMSMAGPDNLASPLLGASGAVATVTGAFFVLFPQSYITVVYWFFIIGTFEVPAFYFILLKLIILDNLLDTYTSNVAYEAHLAGYALGIAAALLFLITGLVTTSGFDLLSMIKQWNRRRKFRDITAAGYDPFSGLGKVAKTNSKDSAPAISVDPKIQNLRNEIARKIAERNLPEAASLYLDLTKVDKEQLLTQPQLLDIANELASEGKRREAVDAYEKFISHYSSYEHIGQVQLMLGLLYNRYLDRPQSALKLLQAAEKSLTDPAQLQMCREEIEKLKHLM
jgi:membrane associated rhomboid family serine protease